MSEVIENMNEKMTSSLEAYRRELTRVRTGRASLSLLDGIKVESYGAQMPLNQVATLTIPENRLIAVQPWDPQVLSAPRELVNQDVFQQLLPLQTQSMMLWVSELKIFPLHLKKCWLL